jgi:hypothetical protein
MIKIVGNTAVFLLIVAFFLFLYTIKNKNKSYKILVCYLGVISCTELSARIALNFTDNNYFVVHIDTIAQFIILSLFFLSIFKNKVQRNVVKIFVLSLPIFYVLRFIDNPKILLRTDLFETFSSFMLLTIYSAMHLYNLLNKKKEYYYFSIGLMTFLLGSMIIALTMNIMIALNDYHLYSRIVLVNNFLYLLFQVFVIIEWSVSYYKKTIIHE